MSEREFKPTDPLDELFGDECDTFWIPKSERVPTRNAAKMLVHTTFGDTAYIDLRCRSRRARIEWKEGERCWWLTCDDEGPYAIWEVYG